MTRVTLTYAEYGALPDDGRRHELHEGELSVTAAPGIRPQRVKINLFDILLDHVRGRALGDLFDAPTDCILSDTTVVRPDIVFVEARHGIAHDRIVDPTARAIDAHILVGASSRVGARLAGAQPAALHPFDDLPLDPAALWA